MIVLISAVISFLRGFIKELLTILGLIGGFAAAYFGSPHILPKFQEWMIDPENPDARLWGIVPMDMVAQVSSYGALFLFTFILLTVISHFASEAVKDMGLGAVDRSLGVAFGLFRGLMVVILLYLPFTLVMDDDKFPAWVEESRGIQAARYSIDMGYDIFNIEKHQETISEGKEKANEKVEQIRDMIEEKAVDTAKEKVEKVIKKDESGYKEKARESMNDLFQQQDGAGLNE